MKDNRFLRLLSALLLVLLAFSSCSKDDDPTPESDAEYTGIPGVIYDTDIGSSTDDLFALRIIYDQADKGNCHLLGGIVCRMGEDKIALADLMNTFYGYGSIPMGVERNGVENPNAYIPYSDICYYTDLNDNPIFPRSISDYSALPDGWKLYRQLLAGQPDHSVIICAIGFMSTVSQLLDSQPDELSNLNGVDLVAKKVKGIYVMGGKFEENNNGTGYNFGHNEQALNFSRNFLQKWPASVNIYFSPSQIGDAVDYSPEQVIADINWTDTHPIKSVYSNFNCNTGQRMWDALSAIQALYGDDYFNLSPRGTVTITTDKQMLFTPDPNGNCFYQIYEPSQSDTYLQLIRDVTKRH